MSRPESGRTRGSTNTPGIILLVAAVAFGVLTTVIELRHRKIFEGALRTTGTVVAVLPHGNGGAVTYAPLVRYRTTAGTQVDFTSSITSSRSSFKIGDEVQVVYTPLNPQQAEIYTWSARWLQTTLCAAMTAICLVLGAIVLVR